MILYHFWITGSLATLATLFLATNGDVSQNPKMVAKLRAAGTQLDRLALLPDDDIDWTFDFHSQKGYTFNPASVINSNTASFPA
jgi:hypothetical protein